MASAHKLPASFPAPLSCPNCLKLELRDEEPLSCGGEVLLTSEDGAECLDGRLIDVSPGGFRALFLGAGPPVGWVAEIRHQFFRGRVRVIWNRIDNGRFEVGCMVLRGR